jgi:hypothetical protein
MANAKTVMVLCNILKLSKSQKHIIRKTPKITKEGQQQPFAKVISNVSLISRSYF